MEVEMMDLDSLVADAPIVDPKEQAREEWFDKRRGKFTCSRFGELIGSGRRKEEEFSAAGMGYIYQVAAERLGSFEFEYSAAPLRWGTDNEPNAVMAYAALKNCYVDNTPFKFFQIADYCGGTPDGLVGDDGCIEVKCPYTPAEHMRTVHRNEIPARYLWQVIGHLLVTGRQWCDFVSYDPRNSKSLHVIRVERKDVEPQIVTLKTRIDRADELVRGILS